MEWREQSTVGCEEAYLEAQRWLEAVTKKEFGGNNFRSALENGVLLCDLINKIKPGIIKRVNRLSTPIAGLDNLNVFLKACGKIGLKEAQLFHPGDLQDLSTRVTVKHQETNRRLKNVLITLYWLGRRAHCDPFYDGPYLNLKAFEGLLGTALAKALEDSSSQRGCSVRDSGFGDSWYSEREELFQLRGGGGRGGRGGHRREDSLDSLDSLGSRPHSVSSDTTLKGSSEGCCSDADEADSIPFRMADNSNSKEPISYRRSAIIAPKSTAQFNQFLPTKDKVSAYVPAPLRKKKAAERGNEDGRRSWVGPQYTEEDGTFTSHSRTSSDAGRAEAAVSSQSGGGPPQPPAAHLQWAYEYESGSDDSDSDRPDPDLVLDDLAGRRFHSPSPAPPTNFAVPMSPAASDGGGGGRKGPWPKVTMTPKVAAPQQSVTVLSSRDSCGGLPRPTHSARADHHHRRPLSADSLFRELYYDDSDENSDDDVGYGDPVHDDLYARKVGLAAAQTSGSGGSGARTPYDKFLPKFWTPEEDIHIRKIKLGSQRRPWYKKMQGFSSKKSGSSSDDSDRDISPWRSSSASSPSSTPAAASPSPYRPHTPESSAHTTTRVVGKSPHIRPHSAPLLPKLQSPKLETPTPPLVYAKMDPTAGPKLIKCEKRPLPGRQDPKEPPDPVDYDSILPDLENDDMFARRTLAFQSNADMALMKTRLCPHRTPRHLYSSDPELNIVVQPRHLQDLMELPDIELDDVAYRTAAQAQAQAQQRPLSGAPDNYAPMPIPEPWALPPDLQARLLCPPCPLAHGKETHKNQKEEEEKEEVHPHPKTDDMLLRKLGSVVLVQPASQRGSVMASLSPSLPTSCSEGDLLKMQAIREASQLRFKRKLLAEKLAALRS